MKWTQRRKGAKRKRTFGTLSLCVFAPLRPFLFLPLFLFATPSEDFLDIFNGLENIEDLLVPNAKNSVLGRFAETTLIWNVLGAEASTPELSEALKKRWLIQGEVNPRQWILYAKTQRKETLLDITLMNSCYSYLRYLITGKRSPIWSIPIGSYRYLPSIAFYGSEYGISNLLKGPDRLYSFYFKKNGAGVDITSLMRFKQVDFGLAGDLWRQPDLWGARLGLGLTFNLLQDGALQAQTETGFKTPGNLPGYSSDADNYIKAGAKFLY